MKTFTVLSALTVTMSSFTVNPQNIARYTASDAADQLGLRVVAAFRQSSDFTSLFPTLSDFHAVMDLQAMVYGPFLSEAKGEFTKKYQREVVPGFNRSIQNIISQGKEAGIEWSKIELVRVEGGKVQEELSTVPVTIVFSSNKKHYRLQIEKALTFRGELKITQFISLEEV